MNYSTPLAELFGASGSTERMLLIASDRDAPGVIVRRGLVKEQVLTAVRTREKVVEFRDLAFGEPRITRENPYVGFDDRDHLDEFGIVSEGTVVARGMVAVSALEPARRERSAGLPSGHEWVRDRSSEFDPADNGFVVESVVRENVRQRPPDFPRGVIDRVTITLRRNDPLTIGDTVRVNGHDVTVFELRDDGAMPKNSEGQAADMLVPAEYWTDGGFAVTSVARTLPTAADCVAARSVGHYSLITSQPLRGSSSPAQEVTPAQISWLRRNGFHAIAGEFASLTSDDTVNREVIKAFATGQGELPDDLEPACPESLHVLTQELRILGLGVEWLSQQRSVSLRLRPATSNWIPKVAQPVIRKPDTVNYRTYAPEPDGLFCETAFGPETHARREKPARIELTAPIVPIIFRLGSDPILPRVLGLEAQVIEGILCGLTGLSRVDGERVLVPADSGECELRGAEAIRHLLGNATRREGLPDPHSLVQDWVYVCPPDIRPLVRLDSGNWATSDLNDHYRKVINRNNRLRKLIDLNAPPQILHSERVQLQRSVDELHANCRLPGPALESGRPLKSALDMALSRLTEHHGKRVDWSAAARVLVDSRVGDRDVVVPAHVFDELKCDFPAPLLLSHGTRFVACKPLPEQGFVIRISPRVAHVLQCATGEECVVHRPLTRPAIDEALRLLTSGLDNDYLPADVPDPPSTEKMLDELVDQVASGRPLDLTSDRWFLLGGSGSLRRMTDEESPQFIPSFRSVPKPPARPVPTIDEILSVIAAEEKTTCLFRIERAEGEPAPDEGRIGGRPWLPEEFQWPVIAGRPIRFLAQLPLEPARRAKALPFDVPADSMLSIFWGDDWWESPSAAGSVIFIHGTRDLEAVNAPEGMSAGPLCRVLPELKRETPGWTDCADVIKTHFGKLPRTLLQDIQENHVPKRAATECTRVGGHAYWVQDPQDDFVAQLATDDTAELTFGDCGSLYVLGKSADALYGVVQCY